MLRKKLDQTLKLEVAAEAGRQAEVSLVQIREQVDQLVVNDRPSWTPENFRDLLLLASYSCLVRKENVDRLGEILDAINSLHGFRVRFTGPWAPFSFVDLQELA